MNIKLVRKEGTTLDAIGALTAERHLYRVTELSSAADATEIVKAVFNAAPAWVDNSTCGRQSARLKAVDPGKNPAMMEVEIEYAITTGGGGGGDPTDEDEDRIRISFTTQGGTRHITHAISQRHPYGDTEAGTAINWNGKYGTESVIGGTDLPAAAVGLTLTRRFTAKQLSTSFQRTAIEMTGKVNKKSFRGWDAGEVLFSGISYSGIEGEDMDVTFNFSIKPNEAATIGDIGFLADGWQYVWVLTSPGDGAEPEVSDVYVATVCEEADFGKLGI